VTRTATEPFLLHPSAECAVERARRLRPALAGWYPRFSACAALFALVFGAACALEMAHEPSAAIALGFALLVCAALVANAVQSLRYERRRSRLLAEGRVIGARVAQCAGREVVIHPSREEGTGETKRFYAVECEYEFDAPSGAPVCATDAAVRADLAGGLALPPPGHPVLVLWLTDELFALL
jgi:hypothetical protein